MRRVLFSAALAFAVMSCGDAANNSGATDSTNMTNSGSNNALGTDTLSNSGTTNPGSSTGAGVGQGTGSGAGTGTGTGTTGSGSSGSDTGNHKGTNRDSVRH